MSMVHFHCPTEQRPIDSGIDMDTESYNQERLRIVTVRCPWCRRTHRFLLADATFGRPAGYPSAAE